MRNFKADLLIFSTISSETLTKSGRLAIGGALSTKIGAREGVGMSQQDHPLYQERDPREVRRVIREGNWTGYTANLVPKYTQTNVVILPKAYAFDFLRFCMRNPKPCPLLEVTDVGDPEPKLTTPGADLRTDVPRYRIFKRGKLVEEVTDITNHWKDDFVGFLLGCSFTLEGAMVDAGLPVRGLESDTPTFTAFVTSIECVPAGIFHGPMVVTMRPMEPAQAVQAVQVTSRYPRVHGAPVHMGDPSQIGIKDLQKPDFGDPVDVRPGELPLFWGCGITPQAVALASGVDLMITHAPGSMFITDLHREEVSLG